MWAVWSHVMFFSVFKLVSSDFSCLRECCNAGFAVTLQKCFVVYEISPDSPSAWGEEMMRFYF